MSKFSSMLTKISVMALVLVASVVCSASISPTIVHADAYNDCVMSAVESFLRTHAPNDMNVTVQQGIERTCRTQHPASSTPASSTPASSTPASSTPASSTPASSAPASSAPASSTPASSTPASSTPASSSPVLSAPAADNRPLYQRIVAPNSADVLTPAFVKDRNPSVAGLVNYLFDFFVRRLLPLLSGVLVIVIIWAGFQYIMAQGDAGKVKQAKDTILFSIIGLVIALASLTIVTVLNNLLLATS